MAKVVKYCRLFSVSNTFSRLTPSSHEGRRSSKKTSECFSVVSNLAVTTGIAVDYSREDFFLEGLFESKQVSESANGSKNNVQLTE